MRSIYFDNNATTALDPRVLEKITSVLTSTPGNPNSTHTIGQKAKVIVDEARELIAEYINCLPVEVLFTASATESNNWAIKGVAEAMSHKGKHIISTAIEHSSVIKTLQHMEELGYEVTCLPVNETGHISIEDFEKTIRPDTILATIQFVNSEIGSIMPIREIGKICRKQGVIFHTDATQAAKYLPLNIEHLFVDLLTFGAHKIYGPKGVAMLYIKKRTPIVQFIDGGQQEFNLRAGTENVPYLAGFGETVRLLDQEREQRAEEVRVIRDTFETEIKSIPNIHINGGDPRTPNVSSIAFLGTTSDTLLARLDMEGIFASAGSACTSGSIQVSDVLIALGYPYERAVSTIRFSFSHTNTLDEVHEAVKTIATIVESLRNI